MFSKLEIAFLLLALVACGPTASKDFHASPTWKALGADRFVNLRDFGDVMRTYGFDDDFLKDPALTAVTREYGPTVITIQSFPARTEVVVSSVKPWSSWWYPKREDFLFNDSAGKYSSALSKYDLLRQKRYEKSGGPKPGSAVNFERANYNPNTVPWEGLCDAWSLAAISKPEPKRSVTIKENGVNVTFKVSELKGLLLKTYEATDDSGLKYYGQKFTGDQNGWIYPDIFPDQFHRFVELQLFGAKQPFIMDHDPGIEVWNNPVYKANMLIDLVPNDPDAVFVRTWLFTAESSSINDRDFVGTKEAVREYDYILKGTRNSKNELIVASGYWVKGPQGVDSRKDHPDYLIQVPNPEKLIRKSWNPEIDIALVDEILAKSY